MPVPHGVVTPCGLIDPTSVTAVGVSPLVPTVATSGSGVVGAPWGALGRNWGGSPGLRGTGIGYAAPWLVCSTENRRICKLFEALFAPHVAPIVRSFETVV